MKFASTVCAALFGAAITVVAQQQPVDQSDWVPGAYIVELESGETPDGFYAQLARDHGIEAEHRMDLASSALFHGASFQVRNASGHDHADMFVAMNAKSQVKTVWPVRTVRLNVGTPAPHDIPHPARSGGASGVHRRRGNAHESNDTFSPHLMTQIDKLHAKGITGKGFRIAIVDSGIDWHHPALGGCFGPGCLVETGWDLVGDDYNPPGLPTPDADPYDNCVGHGTHVAGTIAAQLQGNEYGFTGAAPGAKLAAYRAWGCSTKATTDVLISAFIKAFDDGNDIISCSDGLLSGWSDDAWGLVSSRIAAAGVPVVIAAGNDGGSGIFQASSPAGARGVTGVGAVQNAVFPVFVTKGEYALSQKAGAIAGANETNSFGFLAGTPAFPKETKLTLWAAMGNNSASTSGDACSPLPDDTPDLSDKLVLLRVPDSQTTRCYPIDQGENIAAKGGKYMAYIVRSNVTFEEQYIYVDGIEGVISIAPFQGAQWIDALNKGMDVKVTVPGPDAAATTLLELGDNITGGYTGDFSSWGPTWDLLPKPQLTAPGGKILSTYPLPLGGYRIMTGTSMACPLVAGILALVGEARGSLKDTNLINRLISATAEPKIWFDGAKTYPDTLAPVAQQGAGIIQAYDAAFAKTILGAQSLSLNDTEHFAGQHTFSVENTGDQEATYLLGHRKTPTMYTLTPDVDSPIKAGYPNPTVNAWAEVRFDKDIIVVPAGGSANATVTFTAPVGDRLNATLLPVYSGYITVNSSAHGNDDEHFVIPYLGVAGTMRSAPILQARSSYLADFGSPAAANRTHTLPVPNPADLPYMNNPNKDPIHIPDAGKTPNLLLQPILGTRSLHVDVLPVDGSGRDGGERNDTLKMDKKTPTGRPCLGPLAGYPKSYVSKDEQRAFFQGMLADGTVLPAGSYRMVASALRVFGDEAKEEDWDVVETVPFIIKYAPGGNGTSA
ncbi:Minor extracellular protease vpr [Apiospora arundinis]|uniref:Minor extracellular protease vpr n=1 Tax=Apiospora arundinis TaxID=335852 RepID=A0ABR2IVT6_9PEZI